MGCKHRVTPRYEKGLLIVEQDGWWKNCRHHILYHDSCRSNVLGVPKLHQHKPGDRVGPYMLDVTDYSFNTDGEGRLAWQVKLSPSQAAEVAHILQREMRNLYDQLCVVVDLSCVVGLPQIVADGDFETDADDDVFQPAVSELPPRPESLALIPLPATRHVEMPKHRRLTKTKASAVVYHVETSIAGGMMSDEEARIIYRDLLVNTFGIVLDANGMIAPHVNRRKQS